MREIHSPPFDDAGKNSNNGPSETEQYLWRRLQEMSDDAGQLIRLARIAVDETDWSERRAAEVARNWESRGLIHAYQNGRRVRLTPKGRDVQDLGDDA